MSTPVPPTPPIPADKRGLIYSVWAWVSVLVGAVIVGWAVIGEIPLIFLAVSAALNFLGAACGFLAKNNVTS